MQGAEFLFHTVILQVLPAAVYEKVNKESKVDNYVCVYDTTMIISAMLFVSLMTCSTSYSVSILHM